MQLLVIQLQMKYLMQATTTVLTIVQYVWKIRLWNKQEVVHA
jgi:hypothetical protein